MDFPRPAPEPSLLLLSVGARHTVGLQPALIEQGFQVWTSESNHRVDTVLSARDWPVVLIDLVQANGSSRKICERIRKSYSGPFVAISARESEEQQVAVLEAGADDFIAWPVSPELLAARVRALLKRRANSSADGSSIPFRAGGLEIDPGRREVRWGSETVYLTDQEFDLLLLLGRRVGRTVTREEIFRELRGLSYDGQDRSVDLRVCRLRRKLARSAGAAPLILTVRGCGYQLAASSL